MAHNVFSRRSLVAALLLGVAMGTDPGQAGPAEDAQEILRLALTSPRVLKYLRLGEPGTPLAVANATALDLRGAAFSVEGHPVRMVAAEAADRSTVEVIAGEIGPSQAKLSFRYRRQGIQVDAAFARAGAAWSLADLKLAEH